MGEVYLAQDTQLDRPIALKIPPATVAADLPRLHRFMQEARAASKISGAHAAHIYEVNRGDARGRSWYWLSTLSWESSPSRHGL